VEGQKLLAAQGVQARVVSVPCFELFMAQSDEPRHGDRRCTGENRRRSRRPSGWDAIIGTDGGFVGMTGFGASGPYKELYKHFGITAEKIARRVEQARGGQKVITTRPA